MDKMMGERRLKSVFSHISPPIISCSSKSSSDQFADVSGLRDRISRVQDTQGGHPRREAELQQNMGLPCIEFRGPNSIRECKLLENLILVRLQKDYAPSSEVPVPTENLGLGLASCGGSGRSLKKKWAVLEMEGLEVKEKEKEKEKELDNDGDAKAQRNDDECRIHHGGVVSELGVESPNSGRFVQVGISSAQALSKEDQMTTGTREGLTFLNLKMEEGGVSVSSLNTRVAACVFCDIIHGAAPCLKLYEDEYCLCILDVNPLSFGHSLVLPKAHFSSLECTPPQIAAAMCAAVPLISSALLAATQCDSFNMLVNSGVAAGQVIFHTHFHIIPRCMGDGLWKSESASRRPLQKLQEAKLLAHLVRSKLLPTERVVSQ